jgi:3-oxoacyl-[acyl-carrier protein] reductase
LLLSDNEASEELRINLLGAFTVTRGVARIMKRNKFGRVIYLSSVAVSLGLPGTVIYGATKAGLEQMAFTLSHEFSKDDITFNALGISLYRSRLLALLSPTGLATARSGLTKSAELEIDEIINAVNFFASDSARQITGQTLYFGGVR